MEALPWALCRQNVLWTLRGNPPLAVNAASQAWGPEHSFLDHHEYLKSAFSWRLLGPLPTSAGTPSHFHLLPQVRLRAQWVDMGVFYVARPERPPRDPPISPTPSPKSGSLHISLQHSFPPQMRCYVLRGAAKARTSQARSGRGPLLPAPVARSLSRALSSWCVTGGGRAPWLGAKPGLKSQLPCLPAWPFPL